MPNLVVYMCCLSSPLQLHIVIWHYIQQRIYLHLFSFGNCNDWYHTGKYQHLLQSLHVWPRITSKEQYLLSVFYLSHSMLDRPLKSRPFCDLCLPCCFTRMISEVQLLVSELRRVTLLWDELWLGTLNQHHQDVTRRLAQLENEVKKVTSNSSLSKEERAAIVREKHATVLKPVSVIKLPETILGYP